MSHFDFQFGFSFINHLNLSCIETKPFSTVLFIIIYIIILFKLPTESLLLFFLFPVIAIFLKDFYLILFIVLLDILFQLPINTASVPFLSARSLSSYYINYLIDAAQFVIFRYLSFKASVHFYKNNYFVDLVVPLTFYISFCSSFHLLIAFPYLIKSNPYEPFIK